MDTRSWTTKDKLAEWGDGPWADEPDKVQWPDAATGLPCLAVRNPLGAWCGYVGVSKGHPFFDRGYSECISPDCTDEWHYECTPSGKLSVHGGLTFADKCQTGPEDHGVCHIPGPGEPHNVWWFGFDCAHSQDFIPGMYLTDRMRAFDTAFAAEHPEFIGYDREDVYRTLAYVQAECASLAEQLDSTKPSPLDRDAPATPPPPAATPL